jgi:hypothetical protein
MEPRNTHQLQFKGLNLESVLTTLVKVESGDNHILVASKGIVACLMQKLMSLHRSYLVVKRDMFWPAPSNSTINSTILRHGGVEGDEHVQHMLLRRGQYLWRRQ